VLTVFVATRDGAPRLARVLASYVALRPPRGGWKLVLIDNDSRDDSARIAASFAGRLPLTCLCEPRRGKNRALNAGLRELEGDLAVFSDDDDIPAPQWLVQLRDAADRHRDFDIFGGVVAPLWSEPPEEWISLWVRQPAVFGITDPAIENGPCDPTRVFGGNMAVRAEHFRKGHRFDERIGPDGTSTYAMGGETEFTLRLSIAERAASWHCKAARVQAIIRPAMMKRSWIVKRAFRLGRCVYRESRQKATAGLPHLRRDARQIGRGLAGATRDLALGAIRRDARRVFHARWEWNLWAGCLAEAVASPSARRRRS
jgi:glycosyltransferase involved in cell wall biosynthesis